MRPLYPPNTNPRDGWIEEALDATGARGSYHPFRFVVRLRSDMHERLDRIVPGVQTGKTDFALLDAFSTYFHETLHWWQHIGSTTGLLLSLSPPMQSHINYNYLTSTLARIGPQKPLLSLAHEKPGTRSPDIEADINRIANNWHDLEFNRRILLNPTKISEVIKSPFFESQGHSIEIGLANLLLLLGVSADSDFQTIPHPRGWETAAAKLREAKVPGYCFGSTVTTAPIGALHIFEGQARFNQLQYLYLASGGKLSWDEFRALGMLSGLYVDAFDHFLRISGCERPETPTSSEVLLFLLICDLALNPSDGYPFGIHHFESLIESVDPGIRFCWFCSQIRQHHPQLRTAFHDYGPERYMDAATVLCRSLGCETPVGIARELSRWITNTPGIAELLAEEAGSAYANENLPVRLCFAKHLRFAEDRIRRPEFFCWPAMFLVERDRPIDMDDSLTLFHRHQPPFLMHPNGEIRPALFENVPEKNIYDTFNNFYYWMLQYDLIRQWIVSPGPFELDFTWMHPLYTADFTEKWAEKAFQDLFGVSLSDFRYLQ